MAFSLPDDPSSRFPQSVQKTKDPMADMFVLAPLLRDSSVESVQSPWPAGWKSKSLKIIF